MAKKMLVFLVLAVFSFSLGTPSVPVSADSDSDYSLFLDGNPLTFDTPPQLIDNTMMVPLRGISETLGAAVGWNEASQQITAVKGDVSIKLTLNQDFALKNGAAFTLAASPALIKNTTYVPLRFFSEAFGMIVKWDGINKSVSLDNESNALPIVGSYAKLQSIITDFTSQNDQLIDAAGSGIRSASPQMKTMNTADSSVASESKSVAPTTTSTAAGSPNYSATNVQVQGVDEGDVVKTDGQYIYQVNKQRIIIAQGTPDTEMKIISTLPFDQQQLLPQEIYVDSKYLIVIGSSYNNIGVQPQVTTPNGKITLIRRGNSSVKAIVYDIQSKQSPQKVKEVELEGNYVSSRKIGSNLYLLANQYVNTYNILHDQTEVPAPAYRDSTVSDQFMPIGYDRMRYFPQSVQPNYLLVAGLNTDQLDQEANVTAYLGAGENVYASSENMYVTLTQYSKPSMEPMVQKQQSSSSSSPAVKIMPIMQQGEQNSYIYKFRLDHGQVKYVSSGQVPGSILNQFSMNESNGYFRIATTKGQVFRSDENISKNNVYILDESMTITGKIENIAPGEKIYSVRFMGNRGYIVTFKKVDPLFVIDLADPQAPKILGALKIPGYSDYLHPYDETHLIGFGKDAVEVANEGGNRSDTPSTTAFYQGMKIAMFDVSDVNHPLEMFKTAIGDRGTDSELLRNHKALLFSKEKNLMAFPVSVAEVKNQTSQPNGFPAYGQFTYQGAFIYNVDLIHGFTLKGKITHMNDEDLLKSGFNGYDSGKNVDRILYIGNTLYTLSQSEIRASDLDTLQKKSSLLIP